MDVDFGANTTAERLKTIELQAKHVDSGVEPVAGALDAIDMRVEAMVSLVGKIAWTANAIAGEPDAIATRPNAIDTGSNAIDKIGYPGKPLIVNPLTSLKCN